MNQLALAAIRVLADLQADGAPHNSGPDFGKASPFGLLVVVVLLISLAFLVRSMNRHLRKLPESSPATPPPSFHFPSPSNIPPKAKGKSITLQWL